MRFGRSAPVLLPLVTICIFAATADAKSMELETRLSECTATLEDIMQAPDKGIPIDLIKRSKAIIIFRLYSRQDLA